MSKLINVRNFEQAVNNSVTYFRQEIEALHTRANRVTYLIDSVIDLAERVYEEGDDKWGADYLSQHLSWEQKAMIKEILDENLPFELMDDELRKLETSLLQMERDLKDELKYKEA